MMSALQLRKRIEPELLRIPDVTGVSHLDDRLRIYVEGTPDIFPRHIEGVRVEVVKTGPIKALSLMNVPWFLPKTAMTLNRTQRYRPAPGGVSVGHPCYDDKTRVLTEDGFKYFRDLTPTDKVATLGDDGYLEYNLPINFFKFPYEGDMVHFEEKTIDLLVTPNHKVLCTVNKDGTPGSRPKKNFELVEAKELIEHWSNTAFKRNAKWACMNPPETFTTPPQTEDRSLYEEFSTYKGTIADFSRDKNKPYKTLWRWRNGKTKPLACYTNHEYNIDDYLEFLGWYLSEGSAGELYVAISEKSGEYHTEILDLLDRMGLKTCVNNNNGIHIFSKELALYLKQFGTAKEKYIPKNIKNYPPEKLRIILSSLMKGDGHLEDGRYRHYKTVSWQLANDVAEVALKCGYGVTLSEETTKEHELDGRMIPRSKVYRVGFSHVKLTPRLIRKPELIQYSGFIYSVDVKNHIIFVERNGKTCWSGNSITAGTLGTALTIGGTKYGLSNNHILAAASTDMKPQARIGDPIYQPGVYDGGIESDTIGTLAWYQPMYEQGMNIVDAALMLPADPSLLSDDILDIGPHTGLATTKIEETVQKSGRTTAVTQARILDVDATIKVSYGAFELTFTNQIITDYMASGGDSGSALLNMDRKLVGLLFAGSNYVTVHNHIGNVMAAIGGVPAPPGAGAPFTIVSALPTLIGMAMSGIF